LFSRLWVKLNPIFEYFYFYGWLKINFKYMTITQRIEAFAQLGILLQSTYGKDLSQEWAQKAHRTNNWFVPENTIFAIKAIAESLLNPAALNSWASTITSTPTKKIGVIMAGNLPLVGFHDALCVLMAGHSLHAKLSSQDNVLLVALLEQLCIIEPAFEPYIHFVEKLNDAQAIIATGSDNTAKHFEYYFKHLPHIIRRNRSSVAIIKGTETDETLTRLGEDIFRYYGLGCRNVAKVLVLGDFDPKKLYPALEPWEHVMDNHKYKHNYDYNKSIFLLNHDTHFDNGFLLARPSQQLVSPISVLFYQCFDSHQQIAQYLAQHTAKIQCIVSEKAWYPGSIAIGSSQHPSLTDYADGVNVIDFLANV
jgi:hypothetical protein